MNRAHRVRRWAGILAGLAGALLSITTASTAFATTSPGPLGHAGTAPVNLQAPAGSHIPRATVTNEEKAPIW